MDFHSKVDFGHKKFNDGVKLELEAPDKLHVISSLVAIVLTIIASATHPIETFIAVTIVALIFS